jgi:hypothetical protein
MTGLGWVQADEKTEGFYLTRLDKLDFSLIFFAINTFGTTVEDQ